MPLPAFASDRRPDLRQKTRAAFVKFCPPPFPRLSRSLRTSVPPNSLCQVPPHVIRYAVHQGSRSARTLIKDVVSIPACSSIERQRRGKKAPEPLTIAKISASCSCLRTPGQFHSGRMSQTIGRVSQMCCVGVCPSDRPSPGRCKLARELHSFSF